MDLIEQLETLRISDSEFFGATFAEECKFCRANEMLDDCLEIIWKWLIKEGYVDD